MTDARPYWVRIFVVDGDPDGILNKAHVQYLEARIVELARDARRCELDNCNVPQRPQRSEAEVADAEGTDYAFASPSTAARVLLGRSSNGRQEWKTRDGRSLKEVQESESQEA